MDLRPFDALNGMKGKSILIELKNGKQLSGKLQSFDIHVNLVINEMKELIDGKVTRNIGNSFVSGDTVLWISN